MLTNSKKKSNRPHMKIVTNPIITQTLTFKPLDILQYLQQSLKDHSKNRHLSHQIIFLALVH
jgi:hypothetical protein